MNLKKSFAYSLWAIIIVGLGYKMDLRPMQFGQHVDIRSTQIGKYYGEGYNFLYLIDIETVNDRNLIIQNLPNSLRQAYQMQQVNLDTIEINNATINIWGAPIEENRVPADRIYNVVFHPDVQRWRGNNADFNTNILAGLFAPNGVTQAGVPSPIAFDAFALINVNKHDRIYYSPDNGKFKIDPTRNFVTFWTAALSEDKSKTTITFNIIIINRELSEQLHDQLDNPRNETTREIYQQFTNQLHGADQIAALAAFALIARLTTPGEMENNEDADLAAAIAASLEPQENIASINREAATASGLEPQRAPAISQMPNNFREFEGNYPTGSIAESMGEKRGNKLFLNLQLLDNITLTPLQEILDENGQLVVALVGSGQRNNPEWNISPATQFNEWIAHTYNENLERNIDEKIFPKPSQAAIDSIKSDFTNLGNTRFQWIMSDLGTDLPDNAMRPILTTLGVPYNRSHIFKLKIRLTSTATQSPVQSIEYFILNSQTAHTLRRIGSATDYFTDPAIKHRLDIVFAGQPDPDQSSATTRSNRQTEAQEQEEQTRQQQEQREAEELAQALAESAALYEQQRAAEQVQPQAEQSQEAQRAANQRRQALIQRLTPADINALLESGYDVNSLSEQELRDITQ